MTNLKKRIVLAFLLTTVSVSCARAGFNLLETDDLRLIYYGELQSYIIPHVARCYQNALKFHRNLFHYSPYDKITVVVHDFYDYGNAGASTVPKNRVSMAVAPISYAFETTPGNERLNTAMNHELVHIVAGDQTSPRDKLFRGVFGGKVAETAENPLTIVYSYLTSPRRSAPRWYHEGIATFLETWMAGGLGRALGSYDEMVFRSKIANNARIYDLLGLESEGTKIDFQVGVNAYLYGTRFMTYLAYQYGPELLIDWTNRSKGSAGYFASQFEKTYHLSLDKSWNNWIGWERQFQQENLSLIREYPVTEFKPIIPRPLGSVSRAYFDSQSRKIYLAVNYPGRLSHLAAIQIDSGKVEEIRQIKGASIFYVSSLAYDSKAGALFYTTDNNGWRDLEVAYINSGKKRLLMKDCRVGDLALNPVDRSLWGVRHFNGIATLVRIPAPYKEWNQVHSFRFGQDIYDIDISPDGQILSASMAEINGQQMLVKMGLPKLLEGDSLYEVLFDFQNTGPANFTFSPDGKFLFGSSYYTGSSNIFRYNLELDSMEVISNAETGFFRPVLLAEDSVFTFCYTEGGFLPGIIPNTATEDVNAINFLGQRVVEKYPIVTTWLAGSPADINLDSLTTYRGPYHGLSHLGLTSFYPVVEGYKDFAALGMRLNLSEPLQIHQADMTVSYTPDNSLSVNERLHMNLKYNYASWKLNFNYNGANFYDLFGPTKSSRKGYVLGLDYEKSLLQDDPKKASYETGLAAFWKLERLPDYQNIDASFDRFYTGYWDFNYENMTASLGAIDYEKGVNLNFSTGGYLARGKAFPQVLINLDYGMPLGWDHSSLWLRTSLGQAFGDRDDPFANFYLGGFGNNWIDRSEIKRYREYYSFPGTELNAIGGNNFGKGTLEWLLPPLRFRRVGTPSFYVTWAQLALFSSGVITNFSSSDQRRLLSVGTQVNFRLIMLSHLNFTLSAGYAAAFEKSEKHSDEVMLSLKVM